MEASDVKNPVKLWDIILVLNNTINKLVDEVDKINNTILDYKILSK